MIENFNAFSGLVIGAIAFLIYVHITYKQFTEVLRPKDWLTRLRWLIFGILLVAIFGFIPSLTYQFLRTIGVESDSLRNIATIAGNISRLGGAILLELVYNYKRKG